MGSESGGQENLTEEQLKALYDRIRIAHLLKTPRTAKQVATIINIRANNLYHHFRVLEKAGIIEQVETRQGRGFIKEKFFKLTNEDISVGPELVPLYGRLKFFRNLIRAAEQDLNESVGKYDEVAGVGSREDFCITETRHEEARDIINARAKKLVDEIKTFHDPNGEYDYQFNLFSFRL